MKVLICEDDALIATMLEDVVAALGHEPCGVASTAPEALALAALEGAEFALVDLDLLDGRTGLQVVRDLDALGVPSAIVSGQSRLVGAGDARAVARLGKPFEQRRLAEIIDAQAQAQGLG